MKKSYLLAVVIMAAILPITYYFNSDELVSPLENPSKLDKKTRADLTNEHNFEMTKDPELGYVPRERLWQATKLLKAQQRARGKAAVSGMSWAERGPNNVAGRTRTIMFDPNDVTNRRVFAGSVAGGLWVTDNIYASTTSWTAVDEFLENLAVTSIAYNPAQPDTMYFGTGEGFYNSDAVRGDGIFRSLDGGATWSQLSNTTSSIFDYVQKVVVDASGNIYAATRTGGVQKSTNHGSTWSTVLSTNIPSSGTNTSTTRAADIEIASNGDIYVAMGIFSSDGIYKSTDGGSTWTKVYTASGEQRIEIACAPSASGTVYGVTQSSSTYAANNILLTTNGGSSWSSITPPSGLASTQAWYDLSLSVDPNDATDFYIGGLNMWKSTNSGGSFTQVSQWYTGTSLPYVHADQHLVVYAPGSSDSILFGNDGGVFLTEDGTSSTPTFVHASTGYNVTQFFSCAIHPTAFTDKFLAGSQDNGSHLFSSPNINATTEVTGGDGAYVHIDQDDPNYMYTSYVYNQYRVSTNGGASFTNVNFSGSAGKFINPTDYDNNASIMYCSYNNGQYLRWTNPRSGTTAAVVTFSASGTGEPSAIMCDPNTSNRIYIGTDDGEIWRVNDANGTISATQITGSGMSGYVSSIDVENGDPTHLLATFSSYGVNHVWESTNSGSTWTVLDGSSLPDMPVRWGMFSPLGSDTIFLATELGVWTTDNVNGGSTVWGASNTGLANVRTDMLQWRDSDSTLIAATHGRGLFSVSFSEVVNPDFLAEKTAAYPCETISFEDVSIGATSWAWDFDNDGNIDDSTQNPTWNYKTGGYKTISLTINGTHTETKTSYITVLPKLGTPYSLTDGGNFESNLWHFGANAIEGGINKWEVGAPSNAISNTASGSNVWKTDLDGDLAAANYKCGVYTPSFNMSASGTYTLSFKYRMEVEYGNAPIGAYVEYSIDEGNSWSQLGTYNSANNWYSTNSHSVVNSGIAWSHNRTSYNTASQNISALAGNDDVRFRIIVQVESGWMANYSADGISIDDFTLSGPTNSAKGWNVETALNATATEYLGPNDTVNFISNDCKIIAQIINLSSHDYGMTTVTIDNAGSGTMDFGSNTAASKKIMEKTIRIIPTTNNSSGAVKITNYYTNAESAAWKTATGWNLIDLTQIKSPGAITSATPANTVYGSNTALDSTYLGNNVSITCSFTNGFSGLGAGKSGGSGPLPIHLLSFEGERHLNHSLLAWQTSMEENSSHFEIERRVDNQFIKIGRVEATLNSTQIRAYEYTDTKALSDERVLVYRLKMVDYDGSYTYSNLLFLDLNKNEIQSIVLPNPIRSALVVTLNSREVEPFDLVFTNINGIEMKMIKNVVSSQVINVDDLSNGLYFLSIRRRNVVIETKKITVLK